MTKEAQKILEKLQKYLEKTDDIRFGQALVNLNIIQLIGITSDEYIVKDSFYDSDTEILKRMKV